MGVVGSAGPQPGEADSAMLATAIESKALTDADRLSTFLTKVVVDPSP